jgi:hypothetical protein
VAGVEDECADLIAAVNTSGHDFRL